MPSRCRPSSAAALPSPRRATFPSLRRRHPLPLSPPFAVALPSRHGLLYALPPLPPFLRRATPPSRPSAASCRLLHYALSPLPPSSPTVTVAAVLPTAGSRDARRGAPRGGPRALGGRHRGRRPPRCASLPLHPVVQAPRPTRAQGVDRGRRRVPIHLRALPHPGSDEGIYAWIAANYALGMLGGIHTKPSE